MEMVSSTSLAANAKRVEGSGLTVMLTLAVVLPPVLLAVTVWLAIAVTAVGIPEMMPVEVLKLRPVGKAGVTE
jgi:hypothetical protein